MTVKVQQATNFYGEVQLFCAPHRIILVRVNPKTPFFTAEIPKEAKMNNRTNRIEFLLTDGENKHFIKLVKRSGLKKSSYIRLLINGVIPKDIPPPDYHLMTKELNHIGNNLNQIALVANATGVVNEARYFENCKQLNEAVLKIMKAVTGPERI